MERYDRLLVCLDRSERDAAAIAWAGRISLAAGSERVHFLHVHQTGGVPPAVSTEHPGLVEPREELERELGDRVGQHFAGRGETTVSVIEESGAPVVEILKYAKQHDVDLIVVGREPVERLGDCAPVTLAKRLAMKSACSVIAVPRNAREQVRKIFVPIRLSDCSANALETAVAFAARWQAGVVCVHVYQVHGGYRRVGLTYEEFAAKLQYYAQIECTALLQRVDARGVPISAIYKDDPHDKPARLLAEAVFQQNADLVVIGARGRTGPAGILLGRVTEELLVRSPAPVLAVKRKGESVGLFEAIMTYAG